MRIDYLFTWDNKLSMLIGDIIGHNTERALNEASPQKRKPEKRCRISKSVVAKVVDLSEKILDLSDNINVLIPRCDNNEDKADRASHDLVVLYIYSGLNTMITVRRIINNPKFDDLKDTLIGLEENFRKFYNVYITALNIADPNKTLQRPEEYEHKSII